MSMKMLRLCVVGLTLIGCSKGAEAAPVAQAPAPEVAQQAPTSSTAPAAAPAQAADTALTRVSDPSTVCMVNDQFMGSAQIPVQVEGKTYYGCCKMCEARLGKDPEARTARDPVTQKDVDKASAVIGKDAAGKVLYFESEETFLAYAKH